MTPICSDINDMCSKPEAHSFLKTTHLLNIYTFFFL